MKKIILMSIVLSMFVNGCNKKAKDAAVSSNQPDPNEKKWYVFKHKTRKTCPDVHYGDVIAGRNNYDIVCGPLTKKEAEKCWSENCDSEK